MSTSTARQLLSLEGLVGVRLATTAAEPVRRLASGVAPLDALLGGGLPRGHLSELVGGPSSGRTALLYTWLAAATRAGEVTAVVDLADALDPASLARAGTDLGRVLWVRPPAPRTALKCMELILTAGGFALVALDLGYGERKAESGKRKEGRLDPSAFRLPLSASTWPRLAQVTRRAGAAVLILAARRQTTSCAAAVLELTRRGARWSSQLFDGLTSDVALTRSRFSPAERVLTVSIGEQLTAIDGVTVRQWREGVGEGKATSRAATG